MTMRTYSELLKHMSFKERFDYLSLKGHVGIETFGFERYLNQKFYNSNKWKRIRDEIIVRDNGCDLGMDGYTIYGKIIIHHMNPIAQRDIVELSDYLLNPEYLICVSQKTHNAIHYSENLLPQEPIERKPNDTCPWR